MSLSKHTIFDALGRHPIHPFPARMAPGIALGALADAKKTLRVLDPMMGSGTVLAVARANGHKAIGVDIDPLAVLTARVWTKPLNPDQLKKKGEEVLERARAIFASLSSASSYPDNCSLETKKFIRYWFDSYSRRQLTALGIAIGRVRSDHLRDALWCAFSRLIITKSNGASLAMDLSHSRPHKSFERAPVKPFNGFPSAVSTIAKNCLSLDDDERGPRARVMRGDARKLSAKRNSVDLVLTSPPYLNAIDYMRCSKFSLVWMGWNVDQLRETRTSSVGAEASHAKAQVDPEVEALIRDLKLSPKLNARNTAILARYVWDMRASLSEVHRVLTKNGRAVYVVGDSTVRGTYIRNSEIVRRVANLSGLSLVSRRSRVLPANRRYLPPPKKNNSADPMDGRMRREVILVFQK